MYKYRFHIVDRARDSKLWNGRKWVAELNGSQIGYSSERRAVNVARKLAAKDIGFDLAIKEALR